TVDRHPLGKDPRALVAELADAGKLDSVMARTDSVVCLTGTMRRRFATGDPYETSDYRPVVQLVEAARRVPGKRPVVLVSSRGSRPGRGYLGWKHRAEDALR